MITQPTWICRRLTASLPASTFCILYVNGVRGNGSSIFCVSIVIRNIVFVKEIWHVSISSLRFITNWNESHYWWFQVGLFLYFIHFFFFSNMLLKLITVKLYFTHRHSDAMSGRFLALKCCEIFPFISCWFILTWHNYWSLTDCYRQPYDRWFIITHYWIGCTCTYWMRYIIVLLNCYVISC